MKLLIRAVLFALLFIGSAAAQTTTFNGVVKDLSNAPVPTGQILFNLKPGIDTTTSGNSRFVPTTTVCEIHNPAVVSTSGTGTITVVVGTAQTWQAGDSILFVGTGDSSLNANTVASPMVITGVNSTTSFNFTLAGTHTNGAGGTVGGLYKSGGTGACAVMQNTALTPAGTYYNVPLWPLFSPTSTFNTYAIGAGPVDISTVVPTPGQMPAYSFMDLFSTQTITGIKTFSALLTALAGLFSAGPNTLNGTTTLNEIAANAFKGPSPWYDVTDPAYGAKCDGVTNDTTAIQNAADAAATAKGGRLLIPGVCVIASQLQLNTYANITFESPSKGFTQPTVVNTALKFTGTCNPNACLSMKTVQGIHFFGVQLLFPNATAGPFIDMQHCVSAGHNANPCLGSDSANNGFHGVVFTGPGAYSLVGPILSVKQAINLTIDGWGSWSNANVYIEGAPDNTAGANYSTDISVSNTAFLPQVGTAYFQNQGSNWVFQGNDIELGDGTSHNCRPVMQYINSYNQQNGGLWASNFISDAFCTGAVDLFTYPALPAGAFGGLTFKGNIINGASLANQRGIVVGNSNTLDISGGLFGGLATGFVFGTGNTASILGMQYVNLTTFMSGTPAQGVISDNTGKLTVYNGTGIYAFPSTGTGANVTQAIAFGTAAMPTASIGAGSCSTVVTSSASGVVTADAISVANSAAISTTDGELSLRWWPTANNVNFQYCNPSAGAITPASATINWKVVR